MVSLCTKEWDQSFQGFVQWLGEGWASWARVALPSGAGSLCPCTRYVVTWKMFASLISDKQCVLFLICDYLVASEVERFLIFLFISFVSSFMHWHFVFFSILILISPTSLLFPLHTDRFWAQPVIIFRATLAHWFCLLLLWTVVAEESFLYCHTEVRENSL